ncbi:MAG: hypothetical protein GF409_00305 [Candidatus Omnitrophica bacterium]|nr:hypothetical protein [Candidatus Omnitrophota bacterium]
MCERTRLILAFILLFGAATFFCGLCFAQFDRGEAETPDYTQYEVLVYPSGLTGFFDRASGRIYVYDTRLDDCIMVRHMTSPGRSMRIIKD